MTESAVPRRSLNRDPRFLRLWAAETISHFGSSITGIALLAVVADLALTQTSRRLFGWAHPGAR